MKAITAIVQPFMLSKVTRRLQAIPDFPGMTVTKVQGFGRGKAKGAAHRIVEDLIDYVPKAKIEIVAGEAMTDEIVRVILESARTGNKGDGKIFVSEVAGAIRIRSGETGESALQ